MYRISVYTRDTPNDNFIRKPLEKGLTREVAFIKAARMILKWPHYNTNEYFDGRLEYEGWNDEGNEILIRVYDSEWD